jgi:sigma-E processing peptidase SpoIIGA
MTVMLQTVFRFDHVFAFLRIVALMLCVSFVFGGAILFLEQMIPAEGPYQLMSVWGILLVGMLVFWGMEKMLSGCEKEVVCLVELSGKGAEVSVKALVDSGNSLVEPVSGLPVCVVEREVFRRLWQKGNPEGIRLIPYRSVGRKKGILYGYPVPEMVIHIRGVSIVCRNVYVGIAEEKLSSDGTYGMLLHPALLKEDFRVR